MRTLDPAVAPAVAATRGPGSRVGKWTVLERKGSTKQGERLWLCRCDCGTERVIVLKGSRSCGCSGRRHGHSRAKGGLPSPTYSSWRAMMERCTSPKHPQYERYRALGVCDRWLSFDAFLADMGERPEGKTLDRIDNARGYEPSNCRWATNREQHLNRSDNHRITAFGVTLTLSEWFDRTGLDVDVIARRIPKSR